MDLERRITGKTTEKFHKSVRVKAAELGLPVSEIVRGLLALWVEGKIDFPPPDEPEQEGELEDEE